VTIELASVKETANEEGQELRRLIDETNSEVDELAD
jgi:hypothetical protein